MKLTPDAKGTDAARKYLVEIMRSEMGNDCYSNYIRHELAGDFAWNLANHLLSANSVQDSKPITDLATIVKAAYGNKAWISRRDDIPNFLSPTSADYADLKADGEKRSSWHPDFVVAMYENSRPDKLYTMDQMREYADAFHRSRVDTAPPAQTAINDDARDALRYRWLRDGEEDVFCVFGSNGTWGECGHIEIYGDRLDEHIDAALTAAQSASGDTK